MLLLATLRYVCRFFIIVKKKGSQETVLMYLQFSLRSVLSKILLKFGSFYVICDYLQSVSNSFWRQIVDNIVPKGETRLTHRKLWCKFFSQPPITLPLFQFNIFSNFHNICINLGMFLEWWIIKIQSEFFPTFDIFFMSRW